MSETHNSSIRRIDTSADGRILATGSEDTTIRLWSMPDGKLIRTLRVPLASTDAGDPGKIYSVALAPDGSWLAAAGLVPTLTTFYVYVFDTQTGEIASRLGPLPQPVNDLAVSADGNSLVAGLKGGGGIRGWRRKPQSGIGEVDWENDIIDPHFLADVYGLSFAPDGSVYATSYDGLIRHYGPDKWSRVKVPDGRTRPYGIAVSPDAKRIAVGYEATTGVDVLSAETLEFLYSPETAGLQGGELTSVAWFDDGRKLAAAGRFKSDGMSSIVIWNDGGKGARRIVPAAYGNILDLAQTRLVTGSGVAFGSADASFGLLDGAGERVLLRPAVQAGLRVELEPDLLVSDDGSRVHFPVTPKLTAYFDVRTRESGVTSDVGKGLHPADTKSLDVQRWQNQKRPTLNGKRLATWDNEISRSLAIAPGSKVFMLGSDWWLHQFAATGEALWHREVPETVRAINYAHDGKLLVAAYGDGTIRWHDASEAGKGRLLLSLYMPATTEEQTGQRWILWTPSGYYDSAPGSDDLIGWHVNHGPAHAPDMFPASQFRAQFYRPDVISLVLDTLDENAALAEANKRSKISTAASALQLDMLPPVIDFIYYRNNDSANSDEIEVKYTVRSPSGRAVKRVTVLANNLVIAHTPEAYSFIPTAPNAETVGTIRAKLPEAVRVRDQYFKLSLVAEDDLNTPSQAATINLSYLGPPGTPAQDPVLYALVVGAGHHDLEQYRIGNFPGRDAKEFAAQLLNQKGPGLAFRDVNVRLLIDREKNEAGDDISATATNIRKGLQWLKNSVQDGNDIGLVFFSGHGRKESGRSFLLGVDFNPPSEDYLTSIDKESLLSFMKGMNGTKLLILDACYAAEGAIDTIEIAGSFADSLNGVMTFASSRGSERSYGDEELGSYFTRAVLEALRGIDAASADDKKIMTNELEEYVVRRVPHILALRGGSNRRQSPFLLKPPLMSHHLTLGRITD